MPKKRKKARKGKNSFEQPQNDRVGEEAAFRDAHARLVAERLSDPRYAHRRQVGDRTIIEWEAGSEVDERMQDVRDSYTEEFRTKFGREPTETDPLVFDPDADVPIPLSEEKQDAILADLTERAELAGIDPAYVDAWREVGHVITEMNQHLFSAADVAAYLDAVERHSARRAEEQAQD